MSNFRRLFRLRITLCALAAMLFLVSGSMAFAQPARIGITQFLEHPALDSYRIGFMEAIEAAGFTIGEDIVIDYQNAHGDISLTHTIAAQFVEDNSDLIFAIATSPLLAAAALTEEIPIVFAGVRDPIGARVVESFEEPGGNITGTSHWVPVSDQIRLVEELMPGIDSIGIIYNANELNSRIQVEEARAWAAEQGIILVERTVRSAADVHQATESLVKYVSALFIPTDNTVVGALDSVLAVAEQVKLPVIASDLNSVPRGVVAAYGVNETELGRRAGNIALSILFDGADPATTPIETQDSLDLAINLTAARQMDLVIPDDVVARANAVY